MITAWIKQTVAICGALGISISSHGAETLSDAARNGESEIVKTLLQAGANINAQDERGFTPLIQALQCGQSETAQLLIASGADVNLATRRGCAPLGFAAEAGDVASAEALLARGADIHIHPSASLSAFGAAVVKGRLEVVKLLLAHGGDPNETLGDSTTALYQAVIGGYADIADLLIQHGADVARKDLENDTTLMAAADIGDVALMKRLMAAGLDPKAINDNGATALSLAAAHGHIECMKVLLQAGVGPVDSDNAAATNADKFGQVEALKLLRKLGAKSQMANQPVPAPSGAAPSSGESLAGFTAPLAPLATNHVSAPANSGAPRLAILSDDPSSPFADALIVDLSGQFDLLERDEINHVFAEHDLVRTGFVARQSLATLGSLLHAQALLLIDTQRIAGKQIVRVRLVSAVTGMVMDSVYHETPIADPVDFAGRIAVRTRALSPKFQVPLADAIAISMVDIRAATSAAGNEEIETTLTRLLEHRLIHEPEIFLLDRSEMEKLSAEGAGDSFRSGTFLVDGNIEPNFAHSKAVILRLRVRPGGKSKPIEIVVRGDIDHLVELSTAALDKMRPILNIKSAGRDQWVALGEAGNFLEQSRWADACGCSEKARDAAESAWALGLHTQEVAMLRVKSTADALHPLEEVIARTIGCRYFDDVDSTIFDGPDRPADLPGASQSLAAATRALDLFDNFASTGAVTDEKAWAKTGAGLLRDATAALIGLTTASSQIDHEEETRVLRSQLRKVSTDLIARLTKSKATDSLVDIMSVAAFDQRWWCETPEQFADAENSLLQCHFPRRDILNRATVRGSLASACAGYMHFVSDEGVFRVASPAPFWALLAEKLRVDPALENQFLAHYIPLCMEGAAAVRYKEAAALKSTAWDMRHMLATDSDAFTAYLDSMRIPGNLPWVGENIGFYRTTASGGNTPDRAFPEFYQYLADYTVSLCQESDQLPASLLFMLNQAPFTEHQKQKIETALQAHLARRKAAGAAVSYIGMVETFLGKSRDQVATGLKLGKFWSPLTLSLPDGPGGKQFQIASASCRFIDDKMWVCGSSGEGTDKVIYLFTVNPETFETTVLRVPRIGSLSGNSYTIAVSSHYISVGQGPAGLAVYDRASRKWACYDQIKPGPGQPLGFIGDQLYVLFLENGGSGILALNAASGSSELIASARRNPSQSPFDDPNIVIRHLYFSADGMILPLADLEDHGRFVSTIMNQFYDPGHHQWHHPDSLSEADQTKFFYHDNPVWFGRESWMIGMDQGGGMGAAGGTRGIVDLPGTGGAKGVGGGTATSAAAPQPHVTLLFQGMARDFRALIPLVGKAPPTPWSAQGADDIPATVVASPHCLACFDGQATGCWFLFKDDVAPFIPKRTDSVASINR